MTVLTPQRVEEIFRDCLSRDGENTESRIRVEGIVQTVEFHTVRLEGHREEVAALLEELPDSFKASKGGGSTFLTLGMNRHGGQWTGVHLIMEQLVLLGIAIGKVAYAMPRGLWPLLPGGMPGIIVK